MFKFLSKTQPFDPETLDCHRTFPSRLLPRITTLTLATIAALFSQTHDSTPLKAESSNRPNILFIMADDQGYWDTGVTGNPHIDTPHMDQIARDGVQLDRYYAAMVCAPTRAGLMTGRAYLRTELYNTRFGGDSLGLGEITIAQLLRSAGYRTGMFGKWHLGKYPGYQPHHRGFDEFFGHYHGHIERYEFPDQVYHNGKSVEARGYVTDVFTDASIDFIDVTVAKDESPFFCAVTYNAPHSPFLLDTSHSGQEEGDELLTKYLEQGLPIKEARIYSLVERIDQNVGRLMKKIDQLGIAENTLVVYTSDNGGVSKFYKCGLNGNKASAYEGGVRAPCFVRMPGTIPSGKIITAQTSHLDWFPTFCDLAGIDPPDDRVIDGKSLLDALQAGSATSHHEYVYHTWDRYHPSSEHRWSISEERWKLLCQIGSKTSPNRKHWKLFDLQNDPGETTNLANANPRIVDRLRSEFVRWFAEVTEGVEYAPVRIPVGDAEVEVSPSWAKWSGDHIEYVFDGYDWDTIEGWNQAGEQATWRLNVDSTKRYRVVLRYGCRPLDAGGVLAISVSGQTELLTHTVQPTSTADQFESFEIGEIEIPAGQTELTATVQRCDGDELMRLNHIVLLPID